MHEWFSGLGYELFDQPSYPGQQLQYSIIIIPHFVMPNVIFRIVSVENVRQAGIV